MTYLLDTTVIIDFLRGKEEATDFLNRLKSPTISIITEAEILQGAKGKTELNKLIKTLAVFYKLPVSEKISQKAISLLQQYTLSHNLLILDAFIAATALVNKLTLITANIKHFSMIKGLKVTPHYPK